MTSLPILAELRLGKIPPRVNHLLDQIERVDPDWNQTTSWETVAQLSHKFPGLSIVDQMILVAAKTANVPIVTFNQKLIQASRQLRIGL